MKDNKQKQLFTELTPEEGAAISGGAVTVTNTLDRTVNFEQAKSASEWVIGQLTPGQTKTIQNPTTFYFDDQIGFGESFIKKELYHGSYAFESQDGKKLELNETIGGPVVNSVPIDPPVLIGSR